MRNITPTDLNPLHRSLFFRRAEMRSNRKLFFATSIPTNDSVCSDNLCIDPVCPFDDCSSYPDPDSDPPSSSSSPYFPPSPVADDQPFQLSPFLIIVIAFISALLVLIFYYFTVVRLCRSCLVLRRRTPRVRRNAEEENDQIQNDMDMSNGNQSQVDHPIWLINTVGLQQSIINTITVVKYRRGEGLIEGTDCSVCLSEFQEDETLRLLPKCSHAFHIGCIDTWLRSHTNCPMCRAFIAVSGSEGPSNPSSSRSFGNSRGNEMAQVVDMEINEVELENSDNSNEVLVGSVNGIDVSVIDHSDQNKAEMSFEHGMKLLRRCESMSYIHLRACTVHSSSVSLRRSISSGARLYTL